MCLFNYIVLFDDKVTKYGCFTHVALLPTSQHRANLVKFSKYLHYWKVIFTDILLVGHVSAFLTYIVVVISTNKIAW